MSSDSQNAAVPETHTDVSSTATEEEEAVGDGVSSSQQQTTQNTTQSTPQTTVQQTTRPQHLSPPDMSNLSISTTSRSAEQVTTGASNRRLPPLATVRSVSDSGPQRVSSPLFSSSHSSGTTSPLAPVQAARSPVGFGLGARPPSSSGSVGSGLAGGVSKLSAGMQAKMMAVQPEFPTRFSSLSCFTLSAMDLHFC